MNRAVALGLGAGALALAGLWWAWSGSPSSKTATPGIPSSPTAAPTTAAATTASEPVPAVAQTMPASPTLAAPSSTAQRPSLQDIDAQLRRLKADERSPTLTELDQIFAQLQQYNGGNDMGGVNLATVRQALQAAARIQALNEEMKPLAANPTPANVERMQALLKEMQAIQSSVDVSGLMAAGKALSTGAQP